MSIFYFLKQCPDISSGAHCASLLLREFETLSRVAQCAPLLFLSNRAIFILIVLQN